jgi:hypothetical protein
MFELDITLETQKDSYRKAKNVHKAYEQGSRGSRIDRKWSGSGPDSPPSLPRRRTRSRTTSSPTSSSKNPPADEKKQRSTEHQIRRRRSCYGTRSRSPSFALAPTTARFISAAPKILDASTVKQVGEMVIMRSAEWQDVAESLIETSPLFGSPRGSPAAARGGARIASESPVPRAREKP